MSPPRHLFSVTTVVADGNAKVLTKCGKTVAAPPLTGAAMKGRGGWKLNAKPFWNGWFFFIYPRASRILHDVAMYGPENNEVVIDGLGKVVGRYPFANCFIYDMACKILKDMKARRSHLWKIKTYATDKFHGSGHKANCLASPYDIPALMKRLRWVNAVIAEQTFSWFRGYARSMNELKPARRQFIVPLYAEMHNELSGKGDTSHLNPYPHGGARRSTPYDCDELGGEKRRRRA